MPRTGTLRGWSGPLRCSVLEHYLPVAHGQSPSQPAPMAPLSFLVVNFCQAQPGGTKNPGSESSDP